ncbi:MAG: hypothetical protein AB9842_00355 [Bacteroidales bacterium]
MAAAREYWDNEGFNLLYANPSDPQPDPPEIYFQLPIILLAFMLKITGSDPALIFNLFGLAFAWAGTYLCIRFWRAFCNSWETADKLGLIFLLWGGGLLSVAGFAWSILTGNPGQRIFIFDPTEGWWFLNWGRNMVLPLEAFYHFLFIGIIWAVYHRRLWLSFIFTALLSLSHPFTGFLALSIYISWLFYQKFFNDNYKVPLSLILLTSGIFIVHLAYYLIWLPLYPSHQQVFMQWKLNWNLSFISAVLAYLPLAIPAVYVLIFKKFSFPDKAFKNLLVIWIFIAVLLGFNHVFIRGYQPLHFSRGYLWLALFLGAYPWIRNQLQRILRLKLLLKVSLIVMLTALMLSDNITWFLANYKMQRSSPVMYLSRAQQDIINAVNEHGTVKSLVIADDYRLGYYSIVYTPARAAYSHWANTPDALGKAAMINAFRMDGRRDPSWKGQTIFYIRNTTLPVTSEFHDSLQANFRILDSIQPYLLYCEK